MSHRMLLPALGLLALAGCVIAPPAVQIGPAPTRTAPQAAAASQPAVRAEQVTPQTANRVSQALAEELDREAQHAISGP
jgi:hypothetical protein